MGRFCWVCHEWALKCYHQKFEYMAFEKFLQMVWDDSFNRTLRKAKKVRVKKIRRYE